MSTVRSVQLSATTTMRSGGVDCSASDASVAPIWASSLWAGISAVIVTSPAYRPRVAAMTRRGASGRSSRSGSVRRDRVRVRCSCSETPAPAASAMRIAAATSHSAGACGS